MEQAIAYVGNYSPPLSDQVSRLTPAPVGTKIKKVLFGLSGSAMLGAILFGVGWVFDWSWMQTTGYVGGGLLALLLVFGGLTAKVANCPYCAGVLGKTAGDDLQGHDENEQIECSHCHEWLISNKGEVRAFNQQDAATKKKFQAPVFAGGVWPNECIACGGPVERVEEAKKTSMEFTALLVGTLSVASASVNGIPYCKAHGGVIALAIEDDHPRLVLQDYAARRRYVAANRDKQAAKIK